MFACQGAMERRENIASTQLKAEEIIKEYPLEYFPNWNIITGQRYYVPAPVDKLLGIWAFHLRSHITALILSGNPAISFLQNFRSPLLDKLAFFFSFLGLEEFFTLLIVGQIWLFDTQLGKLLSLLLSLGFFVSGTLKVSLSLPRPPSPPSVPISEEARDWAWPSNHALLGTTFPWFIWIYASNHYDLSIESSVLLLVAVATWNIGVSWARIYLSVHSPCDVLAGWTIGVLLLFIFEGFSDKLYAVYIKSSPSDSFFFTYFYAFFLFLLWVHPRSWPETQSYGEVVCVLSGASMIWSSRAFHIDGDAPFVSLLESDPDASILRCVSRMVFGFALVLTVRVLLKTVSSFLVKFVYDQLCLRYYSYSDYCKSLGTMQPTKRYTSRMRFNPIPGEKVVSFDDVPYNVDLPVKFIVYSGIGFAIGEGCPYAFKYLGL